MSELSKRSQPKNISHDIGYEDLVEKAKKLRQDTFNAFVEQGEAHLGGSFSMIEMLIALYGKILKVSQKTLELVSRGKKPFGFRKIFAC